MPLSPPVTSSPRHVLIVTSGPLCQNPRPLKEAVALAAAGHAVTALTVFHNDACAETDRRLLAGTNVRQENLRPASSTAVRFWQRARVWTARKLVRHLGWPSPWALGPVGPLLRRALQIPADLTVLHNEAPFWVGCRLLRSGRRVAADFEDWYSEDLLPSARKTRPLALIRRIEKQLLHEAAYCTTTSAGMAAALARAYAARAPGVLPNCFVLQPAPAVRPARPPELVWFSQTTGPGRGLEEFVSLWGRLPEACGRITFIGSLIDGFDHTLLDLVPVSARTRVIFSPTVPPDQLPSVLARFDAGLALEHRSPPNKDLTISNKIFQYLNAGLAVIATPTAGQKEVMEHAPDAGIVVDFTSVDTASVLGNFLSDGGRITRAQVAARHAAETRYNWDRFAPVLLDLMERATRPHA